MTCDKKVQIALLSKLNVYYEDQNIANILCMANVTGMCLIAVDIVKENVVFVCLNDTNTIKLQWQEKWLFYFDNNINMDKSKQNITRYYFLSVVSDNKKYFTRK